MSTEAHVARMGRMLCLVGAAIGGLELSSWIIGRSSLIALIPGQTPVMPNTALALLLSGLVGALSDALGGLRRVLAPIAMAIVLAIGVGTLTEYALDLDLGIDEALIPTATGPYPGRPSPPTALAFLFLAMALLLSHSHRDAVVRPSECLAFAVSTLAFIALLGHLLGAGGLYMLADAPVIGVALPTALGLLATSTGLLMRQPGEGIMRIATSRGPGGMMLRRLGLAIVLAPVVLGLLVRQLFEHFGVSEAALELGTLAAAITVIGLISFSVTAVSLDRADRQLEASRARTRALIEQASDGVFVADATGRYTEVNEAGCRMLGYTLEEIVGKNIQDLIPPGDAERFRRHMEQIFAGETEVSEWLLRRKDGTSIPVEVSAKLLPDGRWQAFARDVRERVRAREELRRFQERLELALRGADLATWDWNIETGEAIFNPRWAEMRGFRPDEIRPHVDSWRSLMHPDDLPRVQQTLSDYFEGRIGEYETEHRTRTKRGEWIYVLDRGKVFARDAAGRPIRMVGTELDITERKRLEEGLRRLEAQSSGILSISADAIISIDEHQRITLFNEGAEKIFGYTRAEALGAPLDMLIPEPLRAAHRDHVERFGRGSSVARHMGERSLAVFGRRKDGHEFPADAAISKLDIGGTRILTVSLRDITEQARSERAQQLLANVGAALASSLEAEAALPALARTLAQSFADLCIIDLLEASGELRRIAVTSRAREMEALCSALQQRPKTIEPSELIAPALESRRSVLMTQVSPRAIVAAADRNEALRAFDAFGPLSAIAVPLAIRERVQGAITMLRSNSSEVYDTADVHLAEEIAKRAALALENARLYRAARSAIQARDDVLGIVAHDLRSPLGTILLQATILERASDPMLDRRASAESIKRAATRMQRLIQDLLDITRMESGALQIEPTDVSAAEVIAEVVDAHKPLVSSASLELGVDVTPDLPLLWADRHRLLQVLENLIGNAIKCTKAGGRITVGASPGRGEVTFWVSDTGRGIAPEHLPRLFDRFWQASADDRHHGAGMGLPIVKGIVEAHGGRVWAESTLDHGSTFVFTIPTRARGASAMDPCSAAVP